MAQRQKTSSELALAEQRADGVDPTTPSEPEIVITAEILSINSPADDSPAPDPGTYEGQVIGIEKDRIVGWAWNTTKPYEPVSVELFIGELPVGRGSADQFDIDLAKAKLGNGMHRFELSLDRLPASSPPFVVRAVIANTETELLPSITLTRIQDAESLLSGTEYMGKVAGIADGMLCGWVLNWHNPHEEPVLTLRDGDTDVLTRTIKGRTNVVIDTGVTANAFSFELPLPVNILDGKQHFLSVRAGASGQELPGSPLMFGPADVASIGQSLAATVEKQQQLERKLTLLQPDIDPAVLERRVTGNILDRVDMLLNIHRDAIEREMAVLRRQLAGLIRLSPEGDSNVIAPTVRARTIEDEQRQTETTFTVMSRSAPLVSYDLDAKPESAQLIGGLRWSDVGAPPGVLITGAGSIELGGVPAGPASLILRGTGATDVLEFCAITAAFHGRALTGTVEITDAGNWTLIGTTIPGPADATSAKGLAISYLQNISQPSGALNLSQVAVFHRGRVPERIDPQPPQATVLYVGSDRSREGWYAIEPGPRGGLCWMGAQAELAIRVRQTGKYQLRIPEIRPLVPDIMPSLRITLGGVPMSVEMSPAADDPSVFQIVAEARIPREEVGLLQLRLSFPDDRAKSPMELGLNTDQRPLTIALRALALSALDT